MKTKICTICKKRKYLKYFHKRNNIASGVREHCKSCRSKTRTDKGTSANNKAKKRYRKSIQGKTHEQEYIKQNRHKIRAQSLINHRIADGRLIPQPCESCKNINYIHAHHDDYSKPLKIRWLCAKCHSQWHLTHTPKN